MVIRNPTLAKFTNYLLHNPYWGILHHSTETDYGPVDITKFPDPYEHEKELVEIWNGLTVAEREDVIARAEKMI
jgi:hypothetical protein